MDPDVVFTTSDEKTFQHQGLLPSLPLPPLEQTLKKYLQAVRPHVTDEEYKKTSSIVEKFASGVGRDLHKKLVERAACQKNWLEMWWNEKAYLEFRLPTAPLVNVASLSYTNQHPPATDGSQVKRAALLVHFFIRYWRNLRQERLRPDKTNKGTYLCMNQYKRAFNTCRIPGQTIDHLECSFKTESEGDCPNHVIILCRGRIFAMEASNESGEPMTSPELEEQLRYIRDICDASPSGPGVGSLTGDHRKSWAENRNRLIALHPDNWSHLKTIQQAIIAVILEDSSPQDANQVELQAMAGDSTNRWFDKSFSLMVFKNGLFATHCDHTPFDGMVVVSAMHYVDLCMKQCAGQWKGTLKKRTQEKPKELQFHLNEHLLESIQKARILNRQLSENIEVRLSDFTDYGRFFLRRHRLHPDTHVQLALQYTYYRTYGKPAPTYQTATTRQFWHGRTETMRSCTMEALEWSKAMCDPTASSQTRLQLYMKAAEKHNQLMSEAQNNQGCDRHLLGLYVLSEQEGIPTPEIFTDPAYSKSGGGGNYILSTSLTGYYSPVSGGCAPMCENGYLITYNFQGDNKLSIVMTSWISDKDTDCHKFTDGIHESLRDMGALVQNMSSTARL